MRPTEKTSRLDYRVLVVVVFPQVQLPGFWSSRRGKTSVTTAQPRHGNPPPERSWFPNRIKGVAVANHRKRSSASQFIETGR